MKGWLYPDNLLMLAVFQNGGFSLPYSIDFSTLADGALPSVFLNSGWSVSSGKAVNNPTPGAEMLADPGLEGTYISGMCEALTRGGTPNLTESADVHGGSKAQQFLADQNGEAVDYVFPTQADTVWWLASLWAKRAAGTRGNDRTHFVNSNLTYIDQVAVTSPTYVQVSRTLEGKAPRIGVWTQDPTTWDTIIVDDFSAKILPFTELAALLPPSQSDAIVKVNGTQAADLCGAFGVIARADARSNPRNYILLAVMVNNVGNRIAALFKCVNGTYSKVDDQFISYGPDKTLELRLSGTTAKVYFNNVQVGTDKTIDEATINNNTIHGMFSTDGGNSLNSFFALTN